MSATQEKKALRLYKSYKTDSREYRELAAAVGLSTAALNVYCWHCIRATRR